MAKMQIRRRGIKTGLHPQNTPGLQLFPQVAFEEDFLNTPADYLQRLNQRRHSTSPFEPRARANRVSQQTPGFAADMPSNKRTGHGIARTHTLPTPAANVPMMDAVTVNV